MKSRTVRIHIPLPKQVERKGVLAKNISTQAGKKIQQAISKKYGIRIELRPTDSQWQICELRAPFGNLPDAEYLLVRSFVEGAMLFAKEI